MYQFTLLFGVADSGCRHHVHMQPPPQVGVAMARSVHPTRESDGSCLLQIAKLCREIDYCHLRSTPSTARLTPDPWFRPNYPAVATTAQQSAVRFTPLKIKDTSYGSEVTPNSACVPVPVGLHREQTPLSTLPSLDSFRLLPWSSARLTIRPVATCW